MALFFHKALNIISFYNNSNASAASDVNSSASRLADSAFCEACTFVLEVLKGESVD